MENLDLELVLMDFLQKYGELATNSNQTLTLMETTIFIRQFVKEQKLAIDLITKYQNAVSTEQYELASKIRKNILTIIKE